jgi:hypothetical protein
MNRKTILLFFLLLFLLIDFTSAQNLNLKYYSSSSDGDYKSDFSGVAIAIYLTDEEYKNIEDRIKSIGRNIDKLSKNNYWLCWKALNEWEIKDGEKYFIVCADNIYSNDGVFIISTITKNGKSFDWWGKSASGDDFKELK